MDWGKWSQMVGNAILEIMWHTDRKNYDLFLAL